MKIKVFKFEISNPAFGLDDERINEDPRLFALKEKLCSEKFIELTINDFLKDEEKTYGSDIYSLVKEINKIETHIVTTKNNHDCSNTIHLIYIIVYSVSTERNHCKSGR